MSKAQHFDTVVHIEECVFWLRKEKVILDIHLARLYGVGKRVIVQAVKRNIERFPSDFMFQLTDSEQELVKSHHLTFDAPRRRRPYLAYAFTELGVGMLSSILRSPRAISVNIEIMRAFGEVRKMLEANKELKHQFAQLEQKYDEPFKVVFEAIHQLMLGQEAQKKYPIGYSYWPEFD